MILLDFILFYITIIDLIYVISDIYTKYQPSTQPSYHSFSSLHLLQSVIEICLSRLSVSPSAPGPGSGIGPNIVNQSTSKTVPYTSASKSSNIVSSISNFFTQPGKSKNNNVNNDNNSNSGSGGGNTDSNIKWNANNNRESFNLIKDEEIEQLVRSR